jgi:hypothetical protein
VTINALSTGTAGFAFFDPEGFTLTLPVAVSATGGTGGNVSCPTGGTMALSISLFSDPFNSASFVAMPPTAMLAFGVSNSQINLNSTIPQLPSGSGTFNSTNCSASIRTIGQSPIAGFTNVHVQYDVSFSSGTAVTMTIAVGTDNTLNNEPQPVTYKATGTVR